MVLFYDPRCLVVAGVAPAGRHPYVEELVFEPGGFCDIAEETDELAEIHVDKIAGIDGTCDAVFYLFIDIFILVCFKYPVPDVQQVAEVGVHVQGITGMVYPVVGGGEDDAAHKAQTSVAHNTFSHVNESAPGSIHRHDQEEEGRVDACQYTDGGAYHIGVGSLQEKVHVGDGEVHGLRSVVGAVKAPEQPYLMTKIVVNKVSEFPDDITIDEPVPGKAGGQYRILFKKADAKRYGCDGNKAGDEPVSHEHEERHAIIFDLKTFISDSAADLQQQEEGDHGGYGAEDAMGCRQGTVVSFLVHFQQGPEAEETKQFVV